MLTLAIGASTRSSSWHTNGAVLLPEDRAPPPCSLASCLQGKPRTAIADTGSGPNEATVSLPSQRCSQRRDPGQRDAGWPVPVPPSPAAAQRIRDFHTCRLLPNAKCRAVRAHQPTLTRFLRLKQARNGGVEKRQRPESSTTHSGRTSPGALARWQLPRGRPG